MADQQVVGGVVALDDGVPDQLGDGCPVAGASDPFLDGLMEDAEVGAGDQERLVDLHPAGVDGLQGRDGGPELGDALLREAVIAVERDGPAFAQIHHRDADMPVETRAQGPDAGRHARLGPAHDMGARGLGGQGGQGRDQQQKASHRRPFALHSRLRMQTLCWRAPDPICWRRRSSEWTDVYPVSRWRPRPSAAPPPTPTASWCPRTVSRHTRRS